MSEGVHSLMGGKIYCLDSSVLVKLLVPEEGSDAATALFRQIITTGSRLIAPAFAWAEVGTTLGKKVRAGLVSPSEADTAWTRFTSLDIEYINDAAVPEMTWLLLKKYGLPTMYDAAFLAVCDSVSRDARREIEFWTADRQFIESLGHPAPKYVRLLVIADTDVATTP